MRVASRVARPAAGALLALLLAGASRAADLPAPAPRPEDTCPVCGMFVARYPEWTATVVYRSGAALHFDGAKDLFKYLREPARYAPARAGDDPAEIAVTDYYGVTRIDARTAWYVVGSDVLGPMGHELVPLATREDAEEFARDHRGRAILRYPDVDRLLLERLDRGWLD